jgi:hypothetical protein
MQQTILGVVSSQACVNLYHGDAQTSDGWMADLHALYMRYALIRAGKFIDRKLPEWSTSVTRG